MTEIGGDEIAAAPLTTYAEKFYELFPYYLSIGMTYEQYWDDDSTLVRYYRKAAEMNQERRNQELWLQGRYIYDALCAVAPIINSNSKKGTRARKYLEEPYTISEKQAEQKEEQQAKKTFSKGQAFMAKFMVDTNKKMEGK